jgi:hypothetical protein
MGLPFASDVLSVRGEVDQRFVRGSVRRHYRAKKGVAQSCLLP